MHTRLLPGLQLLPVVLDWNTRAPAADPVALLCVNTFAWRIYGPWVLVCKQPPSTTSVTRPVLQATTVAAADAGSDGPLSPKEFRDLKLLAKEKV